MIMLPRSAHIFTRLALFFIGRRTRPLRRRNDKVAPCNAKIKPRPFAFAPAHTHRPLHGQASLCVVGSLYKYSPCAKSAHTMI